MTIKLDETYVGRVDTTDPDYQWGKGRNIQGGVPNTGTPFDEKWFNDFEGNKQALLRIAGIVPSGVSDSAVNSDQLEAMKRVQRGFLVGNPVGSFRYGFEFTSANDVGIDNDGNFWKYSGVGSYPITVAADTDPTSGDFTQAYARDGQINPVGNFADGVTFNFPNDAARDAGGEYWVWKGVLPYTATTGTVPSSGDYEKVFYNSASEVNTDDGGSVQDYINENLTPFETVAEMAAYNYSIENIGQEVRTLGFYSLSDGGSASYIISDGVPNGFTVLDLGGGFTASILPENGVLDIKQLGGTPDGSFDFSSIMAYLSTESYNGLSTVYLSEGDYSSLSQYTPRDFRVGFIISRQAKNFDHSNILAISTLEGVNLQNKLSFEVGALNDFEGSKIYLHKITDDRFYIYQPSSDLQNKFLWRFDRDESQFDGPVYNRPYLQRQLIRSEVIPRIDLSIAEGDEVGTWADSTIYRYSTTTNDYIEWSFIGSACRLAYGRNTNAGIANITIDGLPANLVSSLDMYGTAAAQQVEVADNLEFGLHTVRVTVTGTSNPSSTGNRIYINNAAAIRYNSALSDSNVIENQSDYPQFLLNQNQIYRNTDSAVTYAIRFKPSSLPTASDPFIGSVHGYEDVTGRTILIDGKVIDITSIADGELISGNRFTMVQELEMFHPDAAGVFANIVLTESITKNGYNQNYNIEWVQDVETGTMYTQMWVFDGAGNTDTDLRTGWCDNIKFNNGYESNLLNLNATIGACITDGVVATGEPKNPSLVNKRDYSGNIAVAVSFPDLYKSFSNFNSETSHRNSVHIVESPRHKKLYVQPSISQAYQAGSVITGKMDVNPIYLGSDLAYFLIK